MSTFREIWSSVATQIESFTGAKTSGKSSIEAIQMRRLIEISELSETQVLSHLSSQLNGLTSIEATERLEKFGANAIAHEKVKPWYIMLLLNFKNPFIGVLLILGIASYLTDDLKGSIVVSVMVIVSV